MSATTLKLNGKRFVVLPEMEYKALKNRAKAKREKHKVRKPTAQELGDVAESKRRLADPRRIPLSDVLREIGGLIVAYVVALTHAARKSIRNLDRAVAARIGEKLAGLERDPRPAGVTKLTGHEDLFRIRIGAYRVVYRIDDQLLTIEITIVAHRREAYRGL